MATVFDMANDVSKLDLNQLEDEKQNRTRKDVPEWMLLGILSDKIAKLEALQSNANMQAGLGQVPSVKDDIRAKATQMAGLEAIPVPDNYYRSEQEVAQMAGGGIVAFANGGQSQMESDREAFLSGLKRTGAAAADIFSLPVRGVAGALNTGLIRPARAATGMEIPYIFGYDPSLTESMTPYYDRFIGEDGRTPAIKTAKEETKPLLAEKKETPKAETKVDISPKTVKKIQKAEDSYEKALRSELDKTDMSEDDKMRAVGFALIKLGAKASKGKKGREAEAFTEGVADAADEYIKIVNQTKKDRRELTKTLAEYGLAKERNRIAEMQVEATRESSMANREATLANKMLTIEQNRQKLISDIMGDYEKSPAAIPNTKSYVPPQVYLKRRLELIGMAGRETSNSAAAPVEGRTATAADFYKR